MPQSVTPVRPVPRSRRTTVAGAFPFVLVSIASLTSVACVSGPDGKTDVDAALAASASDRAIPKSARFAPPPLRDGQWARYLVTSDGGQAGAEGTPFVYVIKVVEPGDLAYSFWFEEEWRAAGRLDVARTQMVMDEARVAVAGGEESFEPVVTDYGRNVRTLLSRGGASAVDVPRNELPQGLLLLQARAAFFGGAEVGKPRKVKVRAGEFKGCYEAKGRMTIAGKEGTLSGCLDSQVPIHGVVEARDPLGRKWELIDFGFSGASSALP